ncbi:palmitoyltransferase ZDHHC1 [Boleophthalmus pectinirostris]|uniref:palmitoyltransferase ZDHHC1 n=1 Tax=Boleophthalmus pectinirostris TaxID=150288 RepID=UPI00242F214D|nr:palmitoyltransferase ZDHHC1 [Boleophthalmus pectinirostris]
MEVCSKNPNRTAPVGEERRADVPLCSRTNGWSWPPHPFQMLAWLLYAYFAITGFGVFVPLLPPHWIPAGYICTGVLFVCHLCVHVLAVSIDPADSNVRSRTHRGPVPVFDRSKHAHVIENCHCFLCQVDVGPKSKHCSACNKCVANFDHHCRWLNNCVGSRNYKLFLHSVVSALLGVCLVLIVASYVFIEFFLDPSKLRTDKHFQVHNESAVWFLFLPVAPVVSAGAVIPGLAAVTIALGLLSCVLLCHLLGFHIYLMWNRLSTYEYIIRQRHRLNPRDSRKPPAKEPTVPSLNIIKEVSYSGTLGYTNTQMEVEEPCAVTAQDDTECVANGRVRSASAPVVEEEIPPPAPTEVKAVTPQRRTQKRKKKVRKVPAEVTRERPLSAVPAELTSVSTVSLGQRLPFPSFPLRASLPPLASAPVPAPVMVPVMAAAPPSEYHSDSAESLEEIPVALAKLGSSSNRDNSNLTHRPTLSFPLPSPLPRTKRKGSARANRSAGDLRFEMAPPTVFVSRASGEPALDKRRNQGSRPSSRTSLGTNWMER